LPIFLKHIYRHASEKKDRHPLANAEEKRIWGRFHAGLHSSLIIYRNTDTEFEAASNHAFYIQF